MRGLSAALVLSCLAATAAAEEIRLSPNQLLDLLVGGSARFTEAESGAHVGVEYFPSRNRSFWIDVNGRCTTGDLTVEGDALCFRYRDRPSVSHCWQPFKDGGRLGYRSKRFGETQWIDPIPGLPLTCADGLVS